MPSSDTSSTGEPKSANQDRPLLRDTNHCTKMRSHRMLFSARASRCKCERTSRANGSKVGLPEDGLMG
jgi:hypothetical protein